LSNPLSKVLDAVPGALIVPLAELVKIIIDAPNPRDAIDRAKFYAAASAAKLAADEALKKELG